MKIMKIIMKNEYDNEMVNENVKKINNEMMKKIMKWWKWNDERNE